MRMLMWSLGHLVMEGDCVHETLGALEVRAVAAGVSGEVATIEAHSRARNHYGSTSERAQLQIFCSSTVAHPPGVLLSASTCCVAAEGLKFKYKSKWVVRRGGEESVPNPTSTCNSYHPFPFLLYRYLFRP